MGSFRAGKEAVDCVWNAMEHVQKPNFVLRRNGRVCLNRQGRQFSRLLWTEVCASAVVMLDTPCSEVVWRVLATHSIRQFTLHFPSRASPCAITFQLNSMRSWPWNVFNTEASNAWDHCFAFELFLYIMLLYYRQGTAVAQWLRFCATNRKVAVSIPAGVSEFFIDIKSFRLHYVPGVDSASNRNE